MTPANDIAAPAGLVFEQCIDCDGLGAYPSGAACKSCEGERIVPDYASHRSSSHPTGCILLTGKGICTAAACNYPFCESAGPTDNAQ